MTQSFQQFIYYSPHSYKNFPTNLSADSLISGDFLPRNKTISQLGIRSIPGTKIYLNGGKIPLVIGFTGLFEIDLTAGGAISDIKVDEASIKEISKNDSAYLIIDVAFWGD